MELKFQLNFFGQILIIYSYICVPRHLIAADKFQYRRPGTYRSNRNTYEADSGRMVPGRARNGITGVVNLRNKKRDINKEIENSIKYPLNDNDFKLAEHLTDKDMAKKLDSGSIDQQFLDGDIKLNRARNAVKYTEKKWPRKRLPYVISNKFSQNMRAIIAKAILGFREKTCIKITPATSSDLFRSHLYIFPGELCTVDHVGYLPTLKMTGARVAMSISEICGRVDVVQHLFMHVLGFWHEQNRPDRDQYVKINWDNIKPGKRIHFEKNSAEDTQTLGQPYDFASIMHYPANMFSKGNEPTIVPLKVGVQILKSASLTELDLKKVNKLYECS